MSAPADTTAAAFGRLEGRATAYRFDLEADIPWRRLVERGRYWTEQGTPLTANPTGGVSVPAEIDAR